MSAMQQPSSVQLGEYGEDMAAAFFTGIGWGPMKTGKHDLGTDLFVQLRSEDLTDLRMLLGAQVKTGPTFFEEPGSLDGSDGWWFRESDKRHAEYWLNHHVPHILILQTKDMETRVWTVLDSKTIVDTGAGIKVFVPNDQVLAPSSKSRWIELVADARKLLSFEGSRWTFSITQIPQEAWVRYALIVPSVVAPHPNRGFSSEINWAEAIAICVSGHPERWDFFANQRADVPSASEALEHSEPGWRLAAAIRHWVIEDASILNALHGAGLPRHLESARAICAAIAEADHYDLEWAAALLEGQLTGLELSADKVWLSVHLAHVRRLQGRIDDARELLEGGLVDSAALSAELATSALRSACVLGLFDLAPGASGDVAAAATAADNSAAWWRTQAVASGLEADAKKRFKSWARDRAVRFGGEASAHNSLFSAALTARLAGNFTAWQGYSSLLAQLDLVTPPSDHSGLSTSLDTLRQVGDRKALELSLRKVRADGPMKALADLAEMATPDHATSLSIHADLEFLAEAGEHLTGHQARPWVQTLLDATSHPESFYTRYAIRQWAFHEIVSALGGLHRHLTRDDQVQLLLFAKSLPEQTPQLLEAPLSRLLERFDPVIIDEQLAEFDTDSVPATWLGKLFRNLLAPRSERVRTVIRQLILDGDLDALSGANDITRIESDEAEVLLDHCQRAFERHKRPSNGVALGGQDEYRLAAILALNGPESARPRAWRAISDAIAEPIDVPERKYMGVKILAENAHAIPSEHRQHLIDAARMLRSQPTSRYASVPMGLLPVGPIFTELVLELDEPCADWNDLLASLIAGDKQARRSACNIMARRPGHEATLLALTRDAQQEVASRAARGLARRIASDEALAPAYTGQLLALSLEGGESLPSSVLSGISLSQDLTRGAAELLRALLSHSSPAVRRAAGDLVANRGWLVTQDDTGDEAPGTREVDPVP